MTSNSSRVWLITGTSTGFGRALAEAVLASGDRLIATARKLEAIADLEQHFSGQVKVVPLDVTDAEQAKAAVKAATETFGRLDVAVNNAGYGLLGAIEELSDEDIRAQFETNVFGLLNVTRAALPYFRQQKSGHFINFSSVGGQVGTPGFGIYAATKFAVEGLSESLSKEVAPLGIKVTIIEPGAFRTDWAGRSMIAAEPIDDYATSVGKIRQIVANLNGTQPGDPKLAARAIIRIVETENPPLRLPLGADSLASIRRKLESQQAELNLWESIAVSTAFQE